MNFYTLKNKEHPILKGGHIDFPNHSLHLFMIKSQQECDVLGFFLDINFVIHHEP